MWGFFCALNSYFCGVKHLVVIGLVIPEPQSTAAGKRILQLIDIFRKNSFHITFLTSAANEEFSEKMEVQNIELNNSGFDELIKNLNPDAVLFDRFITEEQFGWRVSENCPKAMKILDTEDLHFLREARKKAFKSGKGLEDSDLINEIFKREIASILRCDLSLIISEYEYQLLTGKLKISPEILFYIPFLFDGKIPESELFSERKHFFSIGNFLHEPNWQTVLQLKKIWPGIRKSLPETELHIYGAYPSEKVFQLHSEKEGFIVKGRAESAEKLFKNYRILLAPIPFGAGLKGKLFESMLYGIPNITTETGAEGMCIGNLWNGFIEDDSEEFVQKSKHLYTEENCWNQAQQNGYEILKKRFDETEFSEKFISVTLKLQSDLQKHRNRNFLGQILQHHQLNATKYLSKWIEEKNKKQTP